VFFCLVFLLLVFVVSTSASGHHFYNVSGGMLNPMHSLTHSVGRCWKHELLIHIFTHTYNTYNYTVHGWMMINTHSIHSF